MPMEEIHLVNFWNIMCSRDGGDFRKVLCLKNGNYFGKNTNWYDLLDESGSYNDMNERKRFDVNDFNGDGTVDENDQEKIFNLYCDGEMGTQPSSSSPLPLQH